MELIITGKHMANGHKSCPSRNPIALAVKDSLNTIERCMHVVVSFDGLLRIWDVDLRTIFRQDLGDRATHFFDMWYAGMEPETPYFVIELPDFLL